jgi:hypothetical protein
MNRLILKYAYPLTVVILLVFAWVLYQRISRGWNEVIPLAVAAVIVWLLGAPAFIYFWPRITVDGFRRAIVKRGFSGGPIPANSLYAEPSRSSASASTGNLMGTGTDDVLYVIGWLDLKDGPQVLEVPDMAGRYYSLQFTDPATGANFAYVGTRTTGTGAGEFLITGPHWNGTTPDCMIRISTRSRSALIIGRVFVESDEDQPLAYELGQRLRLQPLSR